MTLNSPRAARAASVLVPVMFGLLSVCLGQDSNYDWRTYHLYNAFAYLNGKLGLDLAPAGMQSYLNPTLDIGQYYLTTHWPPRLVGFFLGWLHGLHFVLLYAIARHVLFALPQEDKYRVPLLLALAGCLTANFLSGVGNTMGDNTTSLFQLGALLLLVSSARRYSEWSPKLALLLMAAGIVSGLGTGLKLTNATYSLAMCLSLVLAGGSPIGRVRSCVVFGCGVLLGFGVTGVYWLVEMWSTFGNPLYPQFGTLFPSPLALSGGILDTRWRPQSLGEFIAWPFIIAVDAERVSELRLRQILWGLLYFLFLTWLAVRLRPGLRPEPAASAAPTGRLTLAFVAIAFVVWTLVFGISRYAVPIETLAPLAVWILLGRLFAYETARLYAKRMLVISTAVVLMGGVRTYGHVPWADVAFHVETPIMAAPASTTVILAEHSLPWLAASFPREVAFVSVMSNFPESPRYLERVLQIIRERQGVAYVMVRERLNSHVPRLERNNRRLLHWGVTSSDAGCAALSWLFRRFPDQGVLQAPGSAAAPEARCELGLLSRLQETMVEENRAVLADISKGIAKYGLALKGEDCRTYRAYLGSAPRHYRLCHVMESVSAKNSVNPVSSRRITD
jgi:hypothetical protein